VSLLVTVPRLDPENQPSFPEPVRVVGLDEKGRAVARVAESENRILELESSTFTFCNAGHCPALLIKTHYADRLGEGGLVLGIEPGHRYEEGRVRLDPGDTLCFYTDGVTEQSGEHGQQFGEQRLIDFLRANRNLPLRTLQESLFASVLAFGDGRQDDDITVIIARHKMG